MRTHLFTRSMAALLVLVLAGPATAQGSRDWAPLASSLRPGMRIELDLADGSHVDATVLGHDLDRLVISPRTRIPVAPWRVDYAEIRAIEVKPHQRDGMRPGTKVLIGIGVGVGTLLIASLIAVASSY